MSNEKSTTPVRSTWLPTFHAEVINSPELLEQLQRASSDEEFGALAVELGHARGYTFSKAEVQEALREERRRWLERNL